MKITWIGHACFKVESEGFTVVFDPYENGYVPGLLPVNESANVVLCSHEHGDHNARHLIELKEGKSPFKVKEIHTFHDPDKGTKRGPNTIHVLDDGKVRIAHFGDLGCELEEEQKKALEGLDVSLIPVGGFFTIDAVQAAKLVDEIRPKIIIPMHYRDDKQGFGFDMIGTVDEFLNQIKTIRGENIYLEVKDESTIEINVAGEEKVIVLKPENCK